MGLLGRTKSLTISSAMWIQYTNVTDGQTPGDIVLHLCIVLRGKNSLKS